MKSSPQPSKKIPVFIGYVQKYVNYPGPLTTAQLKVPVPLDPSLTLLTTAQVSVISRAKLTIERIKLPKAVKKGRAAKRVKKTSRAGKKRKK